MSWVIFTLLAALIFAVVFLGAVKQVGDYMNNALDLVFNLFGSLIACFFLIRYHRRK